MLLTSAQASNARRCMSSKRSPDERSDIRESLNVTCWPRISLRFIRATFFFVMPGLVPGIHVLLAATETWMAGSSPVMTKESAFRHFPAGVECTAMHLQPPSSIHTASATEETIFGTPPAITSMRNRQCTSAALP